MFSRTGTRPADVLGFDIGASGVKAVRLRNIEGKVVLAAAAQLPAISFPPADQADSPAAYALPHALHGRYVALALSPPDAVTKLLVVPRAADRLGDFEFSGLLGLSNPDACRIGVEVQSSTHGESTVLASAMPEHIIKWALKLFPVATPAPCSVELSGLAALNAMAWSLRAKPEEHAVMALDIGAQVSTVAVFIRNDLALLRQFAIGSGAIVKRVADELGMDIETARSVLADEVIDASDAVRSGLDPLMRQLVLGRDFVARHRNCRVGSLWLAGGLSCTPFWRRQIAGLLGFTAGDWSPLAVVPSAPGVVTPELSACSGCFAAAMGTALAAMEVS